ncbi:phage tail tip lysozyme [Mesorhizobium sp. B2-1-5]|uniref:phage tail tip lysozyme n=1 Tax=Mesorhizobium sp. B2-1-5 TaxID=2589969 RepID=UPI0011283B1D|nr:phage tail tip lysozyme [Mesorhizobium sp. B2-1-5]TPM94221.1 hypothetical protein FJ966_18305 [Mesorhizobium sp. B2-1-5]
MVEKSLFRDKAPSVMRQLMADFELDEIQSAGVLGNIGTECAGFHHLHEIGQPEGKGGYGWCQWTGPRRKAFFKWCSDKKMDWKEDGYLKKEISGAYGPTIAALEKTSTLVAAVRAFERNFERAGTPNYDDRDAWAEIALDAYRSR